MSYATWGRGAREKVELGAIVGGDQQRKVGHEIFETVYHFADS